MSVIIIGDAYPGETKDIQQFDVLGALALPSSTRTSTLFTTSPAPDDFITFAGQGFTYDSAGHLTGGLITRIVETHGDKSVFVMGVLSIPAPIASKGAFLQAAFSGADTLVGSADPEIMNGLSGADSLNGRGGADRLDGGIGDDTIDGGTGVGYLRGGEGHDRITGGDSFDDAHGNQGNDTVSGGGGDDWVVGGKDNDLLNGDQGDDIVYGNLGMDTLNGGAGADLMRGGQANDVVNGGAGADWLSGDRGDDTVSGGAGADIFHTFSEAGIDRVTDFNGAEGDRVMLLPGTTYTLRQVGADTVIDMGPGQMILVGVQSSTLQPGWIF